MSKITNKDYLHGENNREFSLGKFVGKKVADITGYPSDPFGGTPVFKLYRIIFEDGTSVFVEGEHDVPYIPSEEKLSNMDEETLQKFIDED